MLGENPFLACFVSGALKRNAQCFAVGLASDVPRELITHERDRLLRQLLWRRGAGVMRHHHLRSAAQAEKATLRRRRLPSTAETNVYRQPQTVKYLLSPTNAHAIALTSTFRRE